MRGILTLILLSIEMVTGRAQYKLKDIPFKLSEINQHNSKGKQGIWVLFDKNDSTVSEQKEFRNDVLNGYYERYWPNGIVSDKGYYKDGVLDSIQIAYWENGKIRGIDYHANGVLNGIATSYNSEGEMTTKYKFVNGKVDYSYDSTYDSFGSINLDYLPGNRIDTIIMTLPSVWNKEWTIYKNDSIVKDISFYKDIRCIESFYESNMEVKRVIYSHHSKHNLIRIYHYKNEKLSYTEYFNKKGKIVKVVKAKLLN